MLSLLFSCSVVSDSLQPHGLQHARPPCPSPSPKVCPSSCTLHGWCHPVILWSFFSFCPQSFPASGIFPMSWLFASEDQHTGASASASVLPMNIQGWFPLKSTGLIFLLFFKNYLKLGSIWFGETFVMFFKSSNKKVVISFCLLLPG